MTLLRAISYDNTHPVLPVLLPLPASSVSQRPLYSIIGCDRSNQLIAICRARGLEGLVCDSLALPFGDGRMNACICIAVVHHMSTRVISTIAFTERSAGQIVVGAATPSLASCFAATFDEFKYCTARGAGSPRHLTGRHPRLFEYHLFSSIGGSTG
ncbi:uncharacterized protein LOC115922371 [Strongylocentrotus purpuratus]|uniref:Methyltransferase type 11 domain-containing protein n=1 Tax=Strongylocentrotus purpuratus TaxID=7668 RepID=A0A7M7NKQ3_STRPU|nr:uncharacterized protein LOC115922371 [Strongylocentrotus purpuratus]